MRAILALASLLVASPLAAADLGVVGDSVAATTRAGQWSAGQGYAAIVAQRAGLAEVNVAVSGAATAAMASQWATLLARNPKPSCILYAPGENDIPSTPVATYQAQVHGQLQNAISSGVPASGITILTPFIYQNSAYLAAAPAYLAALRAEAASFGIPVIDVFRLFAEFSLTRSDYSTLLNPDGHPTVDGMVKIADQFKFPENAASCAYKNPPITLPGQLRSMVFTPGNATTVSLTDGPATDYTRLTISLAIKLAATGVEQGIFGSTNRADYGEGMHLDAAGKVVYCRRYNNTDGCFTTSGSITDTTSWHYVMMTGDGGQATYANKVQIWIDGVQQALTITGTSPSFSFFMMNNNGGYGPVLGRTAAFRGTAKYFNGKIADVHFVDGQPQMNQSAFVNAGSPVTYSGAYGAAGSWLTFCNAASAATLGADDHTGGLCVGGGASPWVLNNLGPANVSSDAP